MMKCDRCLQTHSDTIKCPTVPHTPTPWTVEKVDNLPAECADDVIRNCYPGFRIKGPYGGIGAIWNNNKTNAANAAHIVRCVNERAQTIELLQEIIDNIKFGECGNYSTSGDWFIEASQIVKQANSH